MVPVSYFEAHTHQYNKNNTKQVAALQGQLASAEAQLEGLASVPAALAEATAALAQARAECEAKERAVRA